MMTGPLDIGIADVVIVILILTPGFIALQLIKRIYIIEREFSDFETTIWSIFASFLIYIPFGAITGLASIDQLRLSLLSIQNIALLMVLAVIGGAAPSLILRQLFKRHMGAGNLWDHIMKKIMKSQDPVYALVYTNTGKEFYGEITHFGLAPAPRDLVIKEPELLIRDNNLKATRKNWGKEIFFHENEVRQIVFMDEL